MMSKRRKTKSGQFTAKRSDTKVSTIEKKYNLDLKVRSDAKLGNYLKKRGYPSLSKMLEDKK